MHGQCDGRPTVTFPAARHHRPSSWYQIILLGDRGTCVLTTCPGLHSIVDRPLFKLTIYWSQVQHHNHSATEPHLKWRVLMTFSVFPMAQYSLFVLKAPLDTNQPTNLFLQCFDTVGCVREDIRSFKKICTSIPSACENICQLVNLSRGALSY